jgi:hypothetical protein
MLENPAGGVVVIGRIAKATLTAGWSAPDLADSL